MKKMGLLKMDLNGEVAFLGRCFIREVPLYIINDIKCTGHRGRESEFLRNVKKV